MSEKQWGIFMSQAQNEDVPALAVIRSGEAHHRGRLRDARNGNLWYFALLIGEEIIGFVCLVLRRPASWSNASDTQHLPQVVDLYIAEKWRDQGYGAKTMHLLEIFTAALGHEQLYLSVDPLENLRAYRLYQRLGYKRIQNEPYFHHWEAVDADGERQQGQSWLVDMVKPLT